MAWVRSNFTKGFLVSGLLSGDTSMESGGLTDLPTVSGSDRAVVVLDPLSSNPEIVLVTEHTFGTDTATIQRGYSGTVARAHDPNTLWIHTMLQSELAEIESQIATESGGAVASHVSQSDPHTQYQLRSAKGQASGYASLDGTAKVPTSQIPSEIARTSAIITDHGAMGGLSDNDHPQYLLRSGGTMSGDVNFGDRKIQRPFIQDYSEACEINGNVSGSVTRDLEAANVFDDTITGATTYTFSNPPAAGRAGSLTLIVRMPSSIAALTWPGSVIWPDGDVPEPGSNEVWLFTFITRDGGSSWLGAGQGPFS